MAQVLYATNRFPGDGTTTTFSISFQGGYISKDHVKAFITDANGVRTILPITSGMWVGPYTLNIGRTVAVGSVLTIRRETPKGSPLVDYVNGTRITERNLDLANQQSVFIGAEAHDLFDLAGVEEAVAAAVGEVSTLVAAAEDSADAAALSAGTASTAAAAAAGAADTATAAASIALARQEAAEAAAQDADASAVSAAAIATALAGGSIGFDAAAYDFGYVADSTTYFNRDFGTL